MMKNIDAVVNRELPLDFFLPFFRLECALKNSGFFIKHPDGPNGPPAAEADSDTFAVSLRTVFISSKSGYRSWWTGRI